MPWPWVAAQIAISDVLVSAMLAPRGPKLAADQSSRGRSSASGDRGVAQTRKAGGLAAKTMIAATTVASPSAAASKRRRRLARAIGPLSAAVSARIAGTNVNSLRMLEKN